VFLSEQVRALAAAGAAPTVLSYGTGRGEAALDLDRRATPGWSTPRNMRSGPSLGKPLADGALLAIYLRAHAESPFQVALAHNAEAAGVAIAARAWTGVPVIYVVHTVLRHELSAYGPPRAARLLGGVGAGIDRLLARRADALIVLCKTAKEELSRYARGPVVVIPPGLDPRADPHESEQRALCRRLELPFRRFVLYAGNLDAYQDLPLLAESSRRWQRQGWPMVVATHDARRRPERAGLRCIELSSFAELRCLSFGAGILAAPRRRVGGFPIKLLNYMESRRPIVAHANVAPGLHDGESARLLPGDAGPAKWALALAQLSADDAAREELGSGGRRRLESAHRWSELAGATLAFTERVRSPRDDAA